MTTLASVAIRGSATGDRAAAANGRTGETTKVDRRGPEREIVLEWKRCYKLNGRETAEAALHERQFDARPPRHHAAVSPKCFFANARPEPLFR